MGGGEPDRPSRSAGMQPGCRAADLDRRTFIRRAGQTGVAAGALVWSTPRIRSVGAQAAAGSPPPSSTTPTVHERQVIRRKGLSRKRALEEEAERYGDPPPADPMTDPA